MIIHEYSHRAARLLAFPLGAFIVMSLSGCGGFLNITSPKNEGLPSTLAPIDPCTKQPSSQKGNYWPVQLEVTFPPDLQTNTLSIELHRANQPTNIAGTVQIDAARGKATYIPSSDLTPGRYTLNASGTISSRPSSVSSDFTILASTVPQITLSGTSNVSVTPLNPATAT